MLTATRAQLLLRWPHNVAQIEFSLANAIFLSNLGEYHHISYIAKK